MNGLLKNPHKKVCSLGNNWSKKKMTEYREKFLTCYGRMIKIFKINNFI